MKILSTLAVVLWTGLTVLAADSGPKEVVLAAAKKLADQPNYSWNTKVVVPESAQFKPGPTSGKTEKDGFTHVTMSFAGNEAGIVTKGDKAAVLDQEGSWKLASELENAEGPGRFLGRMAKSMKTPAAQVIDLVGGVRELKKEGEVYSGDLTEEGVKKQFRFGEPKNPKGSARFWIQDGVVTKFEVKISGKIEFNGNEMDADRTTTTEIQEIGKTRLNVPAEASKKLL